MKNEYTGLTLVPNINIFRDPRWGRGHETYGEDPYLTSAIGRAFVKGMQGNDKKYLKVAACAKFCCTFWSENESTVLMHKYPKRIYMKHIYLHLNLG